MTTDWKDEAFLLDILIAAKKAIEFASDMTWADFQDDEKTLSAVVRQVQIIGEAARNLSEDTKRARPDVAWPQIIAMRHRLVHDYSRINARIVWDVIRNELPALVAAIEPLVPPPDAV